MKENNELIKIENLSYWYKDGTQALHGLNLTIGSGTKTAILGPNGAGKSTLLLHFNGINLPQSGKVTVMGQELNKKTEKWFRTKVGMVFQDPDDQVFSTTVWEDVAFGPTNMGLAPDEVTQRVQEALQAVGMEAYANKPPHHLSYGQKKRVAIAGVIAMRPEVIILDEPMAFLDPKGKDTLFTILNDLHRKGTTIIIATHDVDMAAEWADQVIIVKAGQTLASGSAHLLTQEEIILSADLRFPIVTQLIKKLPQLNIPELPKDLTEATKLLSQILTK